MFFLRQIAYLAVLGSFFGLGCGSRELPPTTVIGIVTYQGVPLSGGVIVFIPDKERGSSGPLQMANIQPDGSYTLAPDEGGPKGGYFRVTIAPKAGTFADATPEDPYPGPPTRYRNPEKSNLTANIKAGANNKLDFHLTD